MRAFTITQARLEDIYRRDNGKYGHIIDAFLGILAGGALTLAVLKVRGRKKGIGGGGGGVDGTNRSGASKERQKSQWEVRFVSNTRYVSSSSRHPNIFALRLALVCTLCRISKPQTPPSRKSLIRSHNDEKIKHVYNFKHFPPSQTRDRRETRELPDLPALPQPPLRSFVRETTSNAVKGSRAPPNVNRLTHDKTSPFPSPSHNNGSSADSTLGHRIVADAVLEDEVIREGRGIEHVAVKRFRDVHESGANEIGGESVPYQ